MVKWSRYDVTHAAFPAVFCPHRLTSGFVFRLPSSSRLIFCLIPIFFCVWSLFNKPVFCIELLQSSYCTLEWSNSAWRQRKGIMQSNLSGKNSTQEKTLNALLMNLPIFPLDPLCSLVCDIFQIKHISTHTGCFLFNQKYIVIFLTFLTSSIITSFLIKPFSSAFLSLFFGGGLFVSLPFSFNPLLLGVAKKCKNVLPTTSLLSCKTRQINIYIFLMHSVVVLPAGHVVQSFCQALERGLLFFANFLSWSVSRWFLNTVMKARIKPSLSSDTSDLICLDVVICSQIELCH